jgi:DNA ligase-1
MAQTRSRLSKRDLLAATLREAEANEVPLVVGYLSGSLPQGRLGLGYATLGSLRVEPATEHGLRVTDVDAAFEEMAKLHGSGASAQRADALKDLLRRATAEEQTFLRRLLLGDLRQGSLEGIMVDAVAHAANIPVDEVRRALMVTGALGLVAAIALGEGKRGLDALQVELFRPVRPMLAQTVDGIEEALATLGTAAFEYKIDGARIQVHKAYHDVRIFTRSANEVTDACPEIVECVRPLACESVVLDGEAVALKKSGKPYPFQTTMRRLGRRLDVAALRRTLPLSVFFFDCLSLNGRSLLEAEAAERFRSLTGLLPPELVIPRLVTSDAVEATRFFQSALAVGHEGVMAKSLDAPYEAGQRGKSWLKIKSVITLDLVVLAAEWGSGRRRGWLSNLHLGARDPEGGGFVMLGKTFKGMTDEILEWQTKRLQELETSRDEWTVYVRPELVVEIALNDVQKSPHYPGGLALRFARLKGYREDKRPEQADTMETVREIYRKQTGESFDEGARQLRLLPEG